MILQKKTNSENLKLVTLLVFSFMTLAPLSGQTEKKVFEDSVTQDRTSLILNGVGVRTATIFKVRVYEAGLYLVSKSTSEKEILETRTPKLLKMVFKRAVDAKSINLAWDDSLKKICQDDCVSFKPAVAQLKELMTDVKEGDTMTYYFLENEVSVRLNEQLRGTIRHPGFARMLLSTWIGEFPPTEKLKEGLLGKTAS